MTFCVSEWIQGDRGGGTVSFPHSAGVNPIKQGCQQWGKEESGDQVLIWILLAITDEIFHPTLCTMISSFINVTHFYEEAMI